MDCENTYCIYQSDGKCTLDYISIDHLGQCADCIKVSLNGSELKTLKQKQLAKFDETEC